MATDGANFPIYFIMNKLSGNALSIYCALSVYRDRLIASSQDVGDPSRHWMLTPLQGRYFALKHVATGRYLDERNATPGASSDQLGTGDAQSWELVSRRRPGSDFFFLDDDILEQFIPTLRETHNDSAEKLSRQIASRSADRPSKGLNKRYYISRPNIFTRSEEGSILRHLLHTLIGRWIWDSVQEPEMRTGPLISIDRREAESAGYTVPFALLPGSSSRTWMRIDVHWYFFGVDGARFADVRGHLGEKTLLHVNIRVGVQLGRESIRDALRASLQQGTSGQLDTPSSKLSVSGYATANGAHLNHVWVKSAMTAAITLQRLVQ